MEGQDIRGLFEAYSQVYETPEVLNEEVEQINEDPQLDAARQRLRAAQANRKKSEAQTLNKKIAAGEKVQINTAGPVLGALGARTTVQRNQQGNLNVVGGAGGLDKTIKAGGQSYDRLTQGNKVTYVRRGNTPTARPAAQPPARPAAQPPAVAPTNTKKPTTATPKPSSAQTGDKEKDMATWAKANPTLANKPKTPNPLMQKTFGYQTGNAPDQVAKASQDVSKETSDKAFAKSKEMVKNIKPSADLKMDLDIFDLVKGHLLDEGYAETEQNALVIMSNMSEEWRQSIINEISKELATKAFATRATSAFEMDDTEQSAKADKTKDRIVKKHGKKAGDEAEKAAEREIYGHNKYSEAQEREDAKKKSMKKEEVEMVDEAQRARENPEDHDKEEKRKYEPVRGEKTPMPPRGDKRREDFEKWYAKHVR